MHRTYKCNNQVAVDFRDFNLLKSSFHLWQIFVQKQEEELRKKENIACHFNKMYENIYFIKISDNRFQTRIYLIFAKKKNVIKT